MTWFKVDDTLHSHPKARRAGLPAMGLWSVAGSYAMNYKTDGFVPDWYVTGWPSGAKLADKLVTADLWEPTERDGEKGWEFHDFLDYQPTAAEIEAERDAARERQRRRRERMREGSTANGRESRSKSRVTTARKKA